MRAYGAPKMVREKLDATNATEADPQPSNEGEFTG
jgi:hypothetical protein